MSTRSKAARLFPAVGASPAPRVAAPGGGTCAARRRIDGRRGFAVAGRRRAGSPARSEPRRASTDPVEILNVYGQPVLLVLRALSTSVPDHRRSARTDRRRRVRRGRHRPDAAPDGTAATAR